MRAQVGPPCCIALGQDGVGLFTARESFTFSAVPSRAVPSRTRENFLSGFKGTPCGRASRGRARSAPGATRGRSAPRGRRSSGLPAAGGGWRQVVTGAATCLLSGRTRPPPRVTWPAIPSSPAATSERPSRRRAARPPSRRACYRRAKITGEGAPCGSRRARWRKRHIASDLPRQDLGTYRGDAGVAWLSDTQASIRTTSDQLRMGCSVVWSHFQAANSAAHGGQYWLMPSPYLCVRRACRAGCSGRRRAVPGGGSSPGTG